MIASDSLQNCNHHIDKFGNFYIEQNTFMKLENQQKIIINRKLWGFGKKKVYAYYNYFHIYNYFCYFINEGYRVIFMGNYSWSLLWH